MDSLPHQGPETGARECPCLPGWSMDIPEDMQTSGGTFAGLGTASMSFGRVWKRGSYIDGALKNQGGFG